MNRSKTIKLALFGSVSLMIFSSCSAITNDCECTIGDVKQEYYDEEVSCSELEDTEGMRCSSI